MILSDTAQAAVTNRANVSNIAPLGADTQAVNDQKVVAEICAVVGVDVEQARTSALRAVAAVGGHVESQRRGEGLSAGRNRSYVRQVWWVPRDALHD